MANKNRKPSQSSTLRPGARKQKSKWFFPPLSFILTLSFCICILGQSCFLICDVLTDSDIGRNLKTTPQKPFLAPWVSGWREVSWRSSKTTLWGAEREKPRTSPLFGALFPFLNHSIGVLFSLTNGILFPFCLPTDPEGRREGEFKKWSRERVYKMAHFMHKIHRNKRGEKTCSVTLFLPHLGQIKSHGADGDSLQGKS